MNDDCIRIEVDPDLAGDDNELTLAGTQEFAFIGKGVTLVEFEAYVNAYSFGNADFVVLHHTAVPDASWATIDKVADWDKNEKGLSDQQIYDKRLRQLTQIMQYYRDTMGWNCGPHLFIDDRWIWLFSPMNRPGIHARNGNGRRTRYSIGIEVVGNFTRKKWPTKIEALVGGAVAILVEKLDIAVEHNLVEGISSHRDWGKPSCPGNAITEDYYLGVIKNAQIARKPKTATYVVLGNGLRVREKPNTQSAILRRLNYGQQVTGVAVAVGEFVENTNSWVQLESGGYVSLQYLRLT